MEIKGFLDVSLVDWDGKLTSVIYLPNCNFRCPFCHNTNLVLEPEQLETIPIEHIKEQLKKQKGWIDGVCITGGEPTLQNDLPELCTRLKEMGFLVKLDTNGTNPTLLKELFDQRLVDYVALDIKAPLTPEKYSVATGVKAEETLEQVKESIKLLLDSSMDYEFRTTVVPDLHNKDDIKQISYDVRKCRKYVLQRFDVSLGKETIDPNFMSKSLTEEEINEFLIEVKKIIPNTNLR